MTTTIPGNLRQALSLARELGCSVDPVRATGELTVSHPAYYRRVRINGRRKDTPDSLRTLLSAVQSHRSRSGPSA